MRLHQVHLCLQFVGSGPVIITLAERNVFAPRSGEIKDDIWMPDLRVLILGLVDGFDDVGMLRLVLANDVRGPVCGRIIVNHNLHRKGRFLHEKAVETCSDEAFLIVCKTTDADDRGGALGPPLVRDSRRPSKRRTSVFRSCVVTGHLVADCKSVSRQLGTLRLSGCKRGAVDSFDDEEKFEQRCAGDEVGSRECLNDVRWFSDIPLKRGAWDRGGSVPVRDTRARCLRQGHQRKGKIPVGQAMTWPSQITRANGDPNQPNRHISAHSVSNVRQGGATAIFGSFLFVSSLAAAEQLPSVSAPPQAACLQALTVSIDAAAAK